MTWHTKDLPPKMKQHVDNLISQNPELKFHIFDDEDCRQFIKSHFEPDVLTAYDSLIPQSYKSDLWRYCVLYVNGGMYLDIKMACIDGFKLVELFNEPHFTKDLVGDDVYNGLIISHPNNMVFRKCIESIIENVKTKYYGPSSLHPTGPGLLGIHVPPTSIMDMHLRLVNEDYKPIYWHDKPIINLYYSGYRAEQKQFQNTRHYSELWNERAIYK